MCCQLCSTHVLSSRLRASVGANGSQMAVNARFKRFSLSLRVFEQALVRRMFFDGRPQ